MDWSDISTTITDAWNRYIKNREHLTPIGAFLGGSLIAWAALRQAAGAILVAIPFLNENSLKEVRARLAEGIPLPGFEKAEVKADKLVATELSQFKSSDRACVIWGLLAIGISYGLHMISELVAYFSVHH